MILTHLTALNALSTHIVLASGSPRRKDILHTLGLTRVVVRTSAFEEDLDKSAYENAGAYAQATALGKARDVYATHYARGRKDQGEADVIIGADTVVESRDGRVLEKPSDAREAKEMLRALSNGSSKVHTGVAILLPNVPSGSGVFEQVFSETTFVEFGELTDDEIDAYIATGEPFDKAGGYGIQGQAGAFIKGIVGDYYNVMGFPMHAFSRELAALVPLFVK